MDKDKPMTHLNTLIFCWLGEAASANITHFRASSLYLWLESYSLDPGSKIPINNPLTFLSRLSRHPSLHLIIDRLSFSPQCWRKVDCFAQKQGRTSLANWESQSTDTLLSYALLTSRGTAFGTVCSPCDQWSEMNQFATDSHLAKGSVMVV